MLGSHVDSILRNAECDILVTRIKTLTPDDVTSVPVPVAGHPHGEFTVETAAAVDRQNDATVTLLHVHESKSDEISRDDATALLDETAAAFDDVRSIDRELIESDDVAGTITDWTTTHDVTVLGVSRGGIIQRKLLGSISEAVGRHAAGSVILAKRYDPVPSPLRRLLP